MSIERKSNSMSGSENGLIDQSWRCAIPSGCRSLVRQHITFTPYRMNQLGLKTAVDLASQATDLNIYHVRLRVKTIVPYRFEQHGTGNHIAGILHHMD